MSVVKQIHSQNKHRHALYTEASKRFVFSTALQSMLLVSVADLRLTLNYTDKVTSPESASTPTAYRHFATHV